MDLLAQKGHQVVVLDNLSPQIHSQPEFSAVLRNQAECIQADIRDSAELEKALQGVEIVVHLAAETGTGQSMYQLHHYTEVNTLGTAGLLDLLVNRPNQVRRIVLASSRAVYGEGQYSCTRCGIVYPPSRPVSQLARHDWEMKCPNCGNPVQPVPTQEEALLQPQSIYASSKQSQEQLVNITCQARELESVVLRYQNVYGPGQALTNPYTGILCVFFTQIVLGKPLLLFEDGQPSRDFVFIEDVAAATAASVEAPAGGSTVLNVGTGQRTSVSQVAQTLYEVMELEPQAEISYKYRLGDIRHCYANISKLQQLGYSPRVDFRQGVQQFVEWAISQDNTGEQFAGLFEKANRELIARKLFR